MTQPPSKTPTPAPLALSTRIGFAFRRYFITGLATLFPVTVTSWLVIVIFNVTDRFLGQRLGFKIPGLGLLVTVLIILLVGIFSVHFFGRVVFKTIELWIGRLPFIKKIYPPIKQFADFLFNEGESGGKFRGVVLVEYPRPRSYSIAFVTKEWSMTLNGAMQTMLTLVIPTPPSPLTGPILFVPKEDVIWLNLSVEEAFKLSMSGGVVAPPLQVAGTVHSSPVS